MQHIQNSNQQGFNIPYIAKSRPKTKSNWYAIAYGCPTFYKMHTLCKFKHFKYEKDTYL